MNQHQIRLCGSGMDGTRISAELLAELLSIFVAGSKARRKDYQRVLEMLNDFDI